MKTRYRIHIFKNVISAGYIPYTDALEVLDYMHLEDDVDSYAVWKAYSHGTDYLRAMVESTHVNSKAEVSIMSQSKVER